LYGLAPETAGLHVLSRDRDLPGTWLRRKYMLRRNLAHTLSPVLSKDEKLPYISGGSLPRMRAVIDERKARK
jgi:hypothetical protein